MSLKFDSNNVPFIEVGQGYVIRLEAEQLDGASVEKAEKELRETPENITEGLKQLRILLQGKVK